MARPHELTNHELTTAEKLTLRMYHLFCERHGHAPSFRELALLLGNKTPNTATYYIRRLRQKGALTPQPKGKVGSPPSSPPRARKRSGCDGRACRRRVATWRPCIIALDRRGTWTLVCQCQ